LKGSSLINDLTPENRDNNDVRVRDNLTVETLPVTIEGHEVKKLRGKEIPLVKVV